MTCRLDGLIADRVAENAVLQSGLKESAPETTVQSLSSFAVELCGIQILSCH